MTVKPPKGVRSAGNLAGCVGRSRLRIGHESFRFVRNGLESFLCRHQMYNRGRHGTQHAKEVVGREGPVSRVTGFGGCLLVTKHNGNIYEDVRVNGRAKKIDASKGRRECTR